MKLLNVDDGALEDLELELLFLTPLLPVAFQLLLVDVYWPGNEASQSRKRVVDLGTAGLLDAGVVLPALTFASCS